MKVIIALLLVIYATQAFAKSYYLQRFIAPTKIAPTHADYYKRQANLRNAEKAVVSYPWLAWLEQPTAEYINELTTHTFEEHLRMIGLPYAFYSRERTVLTYADGTQIIHSTISDSTRNYWQFKQRGKEGIEPVVVSVRNSDGVAKGEYLYNERNVNYLHNVFATSGFRFEDFLDRVEAPIINVAAGGTYLSWQLSKLRTDRHTKKVPREEREHGQVFSLDISGSYDALTAKPWYLFGDMYDSGLPDNTFGAVLALGGPMRKKICPQHECVDALRELARIAQPKGRLLIEYSIPTVNIISALEKAGFNYSELLTYESSPHPKLGVSKQTRLLEILLDKD